MTAYTWFPLITEGRSAFFAYMKNHSLFGLLSVPPAEEKQMSKGNLRHIHTGT